MEQYSDIEFEDWEGMTAEQAEALAAGLQAEEEAYRSQLGVGFIYLASGLYAEEACTYCGGRGGEPASVDLYVPCPMCNDGRGK